MPVNALIYGRLSLVEKLSGCNFFNSLCSNADAVTTATQRRGIALLIATLERSRQRIYGHFSRIANDRSLFKTAG